MLQTSHMLWGYVIGILLARRLKVRDSINHKVLLACGAIPDIDIPLGWALGFEYGTLLGHHGIFHSWFAITLSFLPLIVFHNIRLVPYYVATIQHVIFGDILLNEVPVYFPLSLKQEGFYLFSYNPYISMLIEMIGIIAYLILLKPLVIEKTLNLLTVLIWIGIGSTLLFQANDTYKFLGLYTLLGAYSIFSLFSLILIGIVWIRMVHLIIVVLPRSKKVNKNG